VDKFGTGTLAHERKLAEREDRLHKGASISAAQSANTILKGRCSRYPLQARVYAEIKKVKTRRSQQLGDKAGSRADEPRKWQAWGVGRKLLEPRREEKGMRQRALGKAMSLTEGRK